MSEITRISKGRILKDVEEYLNNLTDEERMATFSINGVPIADAIVFPKKVIESLLVANATGNRVGEKDVCNQIRKIAEDIERDRR